MSADIQTSLSRGWDLFRRRVKMYRKLHETWLSEMNCSQGDFNIVMTSVDYTLCNDEGWLNMYLYCQMYKKSCT